MLLRKILPSIFPLALYSFASYSQDSISFPKKSEQSVELIGDVFINSNTITNKFIWSFYQGGYISNQRKENVTKQLLPSNVLGAAAKTGFTYSYNLLEGNNKPVFSFSFFDRQHLDVKFSNDLFYTIFYGNKIFEGQTAQLGNFRLNLLRYQQFRFGWKWKGDVTHGSYGVAFSLLNGEQNIFVKASRADLYTSTNGTYLDFALAMQVQKSDPALKKFFAQNGMGASMDLFYELPYRIGKRYGKFAVEVNDLGIIQWKSSSMSYSVDSSYHYDGINVNDIFNSHGAFPSLNTDTIIKKHTSFERKQYITNLPFTLHIHTQAWHGKHVLFEKGISFLFYSSAKPYYYTKTHYYNKKQNIGFACTVGYGA